MDKIDFASKIRDIPNFPRQGIIFRDITTLLKDGPVFHAAIEQLAEKVRPWKPDKVVGIESRGFIFGGPLAYILNAGFVPARKLGKLPFDTITEEYELEYGTNTVELHRDAIEPGERVLVVDDLLATGGTTRATIELVKRLGGEVVGLAYLIELSGLNAREQLEGYEVATLIKY